MKPKGYIKFYNRNSCEDCIFYNINNQNLPKQERTYTCDKTNNNLEVDFNDVCDEYEKLT